MRVRTLRSRGLTVAMTAAVSFILLAACGGSSTPGALAPSSTSSPSPSSVPPAPTMQPPAPTPTPSPTPLPITSDDLTEALPTNPMLSKVQGYPFKENKNWVEGGDEGPEWAADAPLTKEQARQIGVRALRRVKPDTCEAMAVFDTYGWTRRWSASDYVQAAAYTKKANAYRYYKTGLVPNWTSLPLLLPTGAAAQWVSNIRATTKSCTRYTVIKANGDIEKVNSPAARKNLRISWRESGDAIIWRAVPKSGRRMVLVSVAEPIGNVLYSTITFILSDDKRRWARASALYNRLADSIAKAQGIKRKPVDLLGGTTFTPNPDEYQAPTPPSSTMA